jgi:type III secretory pathway component EscR
MKKQYKTKDCDKFKQIVKWQKKKGNGHEPYDNGLNKSTQKQDFQLQKEKARHTRFI